MLLLVFTLACVVEDRTESVQSNDDFQDLRVDVDAGSVRLAADPTLTSGLFGQVRIRSGGQPPDLDVHLEGGTQFVEARCPEDGGYCTTDVDLKIPLGRAVSVNTGAGDIIIEDVDAAVDIVTETGAILLVGLGGVVNAETGSGAIVGDELRGDTVAVETGAGHIDILLEDDFTLLDVGTGMGDIDLQVPSAAYVVETETEIGSTTLTSITEDLGAKARIDAETGAGDIQIVGRNF